jgi:hypothetical protein
MFGDMANLFGEETLILLESKELPKEIQELEWYRRRRVIAKDELVRIITEQKNGGHKVALLE